MVLIRPHHLLCMLHFNGKGYNQSFIDNMQQVIKRIKSGEKIKVVFGEDDICQPLKNTHHWHCDAKSVDERDKKSWEIINRHIQIESNLFSLDMFNELRAMFNKELFKSACDACQWHDLCYKSEPDKLKNKASL